VTAAVWSLKCLKSLFSVFSSKHQTANAEKQNRCRLGDKFKSVITHNPLIVITYIVSIVSIVRPPFMAAIEYLLDI